MDSILQLQSLSIGYQSKKQNKVVVDDINASLSTGELVCLLGPNGAGKSTLMRTISGMQKPLGGDIKLARNTIQDLSAKQLAKQLSLVLTDRVQAGMLTAYEVVALGRYPHINWTGKLNQKDHKIIQWAIEMTSAVELKDRVLAELSDGEKQKIMVARALAQEPEVMILDEVTAFLDLPRRIEIMHVLRNLAYTANKAILLSTHDLDLAIRNADRLWLLPKDGKLHVGAPEDLIMNGTLEKAFASDGVVFNQSNGTFQSRVMYDESVSLVGTGEAFDWTRNALHRIGFSIDDNAHIQIKVESRNGTHQWTVRESDHTITSYTSLYDVMTHLRKEFHNSNFWKIS